MQAAQAAGEIQSASRPKIRACILVFYYGGPSHLDTYDLKPDAPAEVRGEFKPIATTVPGLHVCEHLPRMAKVMHEVALIRSLRHPMRNHDSASAETLTGRTPLVGDLEIINDDTQGFPSLGAMLSHLWRVRRLGDRLGDPLPVCHAALPFVMHNVTKNQGQSAGFLGAADAPFLIEGDPATLTYRSEVLKRSADMPAERLASRKQLLGAIDRGSDASGTQRRAAAMRKFYDRAFALLESEAVRLALDIEQEDPKTRDRYGYGFKDERFEDGPFGNVGAFLGIGRNLRGLNLLLARRLVEAGVPFVTVYDFKQQGKNWDSHNANFPQLKDHLLPLADQGLSALIEDLDARGLLETTLVLALGEFGRTPKINSAAGRDHWPDCYSAILAGGGVKGGLVHGASDRLGAYPAADPVTPADLAATVFWRFGIDPATEIHDSTGRPYKVAEGRPLGSLFAGGA